MSVKAVKAASGKAPALKKVVAPKKKATIKPKSAAPTVGDQRVPNSKGNKRYTLFVVDKDMQVFKRAAKKQGVSYQSLVREALSKAAEKLKGAL